MCKNCGKIFTNFHEASESAIPPLTRVLFYNKDNDRVEELNTAEFCVECLIRIIFIPNHLNFGVA